MATDEPGRARCSRCGTGLGFDAWSAGQDRCEQCAGAAAGPAATYVRGPGAPGRARPQSDEELYLQLLDEVPDSLIDELVAALEAEAAREATPVGVPAGTVQGALHEMGIGISPREGSWAGWGFAAGFAANVLLAKYAQMASGAPMSAFVAPMLLGGMVAGAACAGIGWGLARLRER